MFTNRRIGIAAALSSRQRTPPTQVAGNQGQNPSPQGSAPPADTCTKATTPIIQRLTRNESVCTDRAINGREQSAGTNRAIETGGRPMHIRPRSMLAALAAATALATPALATELTVTCRCVEGGVNSATAVWMKESVIPAFTEKMKAEGKDVTVTLKEFAGQDEQLTQQLALDFSSGAGADISGFDGFLIPSFVEGGLLKPLDEIGGRGSRRVGRLGAHLAGHPGADVLPGQGLRHRARHRRADDLRAQGSLPEGRPRRRRLAADLLGRGPRRRPRDQEGRPRELPAAAQRRRQHGRGDDHAGLLDGAPRHRRAGDRRERQVDRGQPGHPRHPQPLQDDLPRRGPRRPARPAPRRRTQPHLRQLPRRQDRDAGRGRLVLPLGRRRPTASSPSPTATR